MWNGLPGSYPGCDSQDPSRLGVSTSPERRGIGSTGLSILRPKESQGIANCRSNWLAPPNVVRGRKLRSADAVPMSQQPPEHSPGPVAPGCGRNGSRGGGGVYAAPPFPVLRDPPHGTRCPPPPTVDAARSNCAFVLRTHRSPVSKEDRSGRRIPAH